MSDSRLPSSVRSLIVANAVSAVGRGMVLPLTLIYLHRVRDIPLGTTGLLLAIPGVVGLVVVPTAGAVMDRIGARRVLVASLIVTAGAQVALAYVTTAGWAVLVMLLQGVAIAPTFPALNTLLGLFAEGEVQQRAYAVNFAVLNAGIGLGGLVGAAVVNVHHAETFQLMFLGNALAALIASVLVFRLPNPTLGGTDAHREHHERGGYRLVLADAVRRQVVVITLLLALVGYAALDAGLPAYANVVADVPVRVIALGLTANTAVIVLAQLGVLRLLRGRRRSYALAVVGIIWAVSWVILGACALPGSIAARSAITIFFAALFGVGETFMAPSLSSLLNTITPAEIRGRANALTSGMYSLAFVVSPAISAGLISTGLGGLWIGLLVGGCLVVTAMSVRMSRRLPRRIDVAQDDDAVVPEPEPATVAG